MSHNGNRDNSHDLLLTVAWKDDSVVLIDQTKLPNKLVYVRCKDYKEVANAIKNLVVRGAPAIGITAALGLALGVIRAAREDGKCVTVIATETRPVMQGSRLTAFELQHDGIDVSLIPDTAVGFMMSRGAIRRVIVGADRILRTGHVFNKIGTYQVAIMANLHKIPFYVAAPFSTFDFKNSPEDIVIEERSGEEVTKIGKKRIAPKGVQAFNPAFDI